VRTLAALGFQRVPEPNDLTLLYAPFTAQTPPLLARLYYTWGDSDLF
jgi:hypothetical protein